MNKFKLHYFIFLIICFLSIRVNASFQNYFIGPSKQYPFSRYKEVLYSVKSENNGVFGESETTLFYKMLIKVNESDSLEYLIQEYSDSSFLEDKITRFYYSKESQNSKFDNFYTAVISSVFFGRSSELYSLNISFFKTEKMLSDFRQNDKTEVLIHETEKKIFNKLKKIENGIPKNVMKNTDQSQIYFVGEYNFNRALSVGYNFNDSNDNDKISKFVFSKLHKTVNLNEGFLSYETKSKEFSEFKYMNYFVVLDLNTQFVSDLYVKNLIFKNENKKSLMTVLQVNNFKSGSLDLFNLSKRLTKLNLNRFNLNDFLM